MGGDGFEIGYNERIFFTEVILMRLIGIALLAALVISPSTFAKDKESSLEKAIKGEIRSDDHPGQGSGRPDNPGEHGKDNAAEKQSRGHGNGSKKEESWEDRVRDEFEDDDDKDKGKDKKKNNKK
jgi:hypothetical protein